MTVGPVMRKVDDVIIIMEFTAISTSNTFDIAR